jgi:Leucine-rich repeat (LRR) protein
VKPIAEIFEGLSSLYRLEICGFRFEGGMLKRDLFKYVAATLDELKLHKNGISHIEPGTFQQMKSLITLSLSENSLEKWTNAMMRELPRVNSLDLTKNKIIEFLDHDDWLDMNKPPRLHTLNLSSNNLTTSSVNQLAAFATSLVSLNLSHNFIDTIELSNGKRLFEGLLSLRKLDLYANMFSSIDLAVFDHGLDNLRVLRLGGLKLISIIQTSPALINRYKGYSQLMQQVCVELEKSKHIEDRTAIEKWPRTLTVKLCGAFFMI